MPGLLSRTRVWLGLHGRQAVFFMGNDEDTSFWGNYDFAKAIKVGMEKINLPWD